VDVRERRRVIAVGEARTNRIRRSRRPEQPDSGPGRDRVVPGLKVASVLATTVLILLPAGTAHNLSLLGGHLAVTWSELVTPLLVAHIALMPARSPANIRLSALSAILGLLAVPAVLSPSLSSALAAFFNFAFGVIAGFAIGYVWTLVPSDRLNSVDIGVLVSSTIISIQVFAAISGKANDAIHVSAATDLGGSNYLAGILAVLALAAYGRLRVVGAPVVAYGLIVIPVAAIVSTLSRGGLVALAVGACVVLWQDTSHTTWVVPRRMALVAILFVASYGLARISAIRGQGIDLNVSTRYALFRLAWNGFLSSPLTGQGWATFRDVTRDSIGEPITFAHNLLLSFLQIGGILAVPLLVIIVRWTILAAKHRPEMLPAIAAGIALAMTDPLLEGFVGGLVMWIALYPTSTSGRPGIRALVNYQRDLGASGGSESLGAGVTRAPSRRPWPQNS